MDVFLAFVSGILESSDGKQIPDDTQCVHDKLMLKLALLM